MKNTTDIAGQLENLRARVIRANVLSWIAVVLAFTGGAYANHLLVLSSDIVDGEVKTPDLATSAVTNSKIAASAVGNAKIATGAVTNTKIAAGAVTSAKIAAGAVTTAKIADGAVTGAKVADGSLTGAEVTDGSLTSADINQSTLDAIDASTLNDFTRFEVASTGEAPERAFQQDLPDCAPGIDYLVRTIRVPRDGWVVVNSLFTATGSEVGGAAVAARVERTAPGFVAGTYGETTAGFGQRVNLSMTDRIPVIAGDNTFVIKACDAFDPIDQGAYAVRAKMTFIYSANLLTSF